MTSHSPRLSPTERHGFELATPIHSPHHSVNSSVSSRTPLHALSLHEYHKLQNTPTSQSATPPGKTLRRKAAASALNELERVPSVRRTPVSALRLSSRSLHSSKSAHQLTAYQPLPPSPPHFEQTGPIDNSFRSQSAGPYTSGVSLLKEVTSLRAPSALSVSSKVGNWKPIKKLPKPSAGWPPKHIPPPPLNPEKSISPFQTTPTSSSDNVASSGAQTTPSTFSLSRFPHPPHLVNPSLSPPIYENATPSLNNSFATTAPATPPATPAVIHYRGTSFDLVNPHDSLLFHDIVTPSRELDSSEYLPLQSSEEPLLHHEVRTHIYLC
jgi:hypothetical protein